MPGLWGGVPEPVVLHLLRPSPVPLRGGVQQQVGLVQRMLPAAVEQEGCGGCGDFA